jgi:hypothetical protein
MYAAGAFLYCLLNVTPDLPTHPHTLPLRHIGLAFPLVVTITIQYTI